MAGEQAQGWQPVAEPAAGGQDTSAWQPVAATGTPPPGPAPLRSAKTSPPPSYLKPVSPETQRLVGGALGATAVAAATEGLGLIPEAAGVGAGLVARGASMVARHLPSVLGAGAGGSTVAAAQGAPPKEIARAGGEQAAYELGGKAVAWPLVATGRRILGSAIGKQVTESLASSRAAITGQVQAALDAAHGLLAKSRTARAEAVQSARSTADAGVQAARTGAKEEVGKVGASLAKHEAFQGTRLETEIPKPAVSHAQAGEMAHDAIQGPAKSSLDQLGEAVDGAAQSGPDLDLRPVKEKLLALRQQILPAVSHEAAPVTVAGKELSPEVVAKLAERNPELGLSTVTPPTVPLAADHPLPGVLHALETGPDTVPFSEAHKFKRLLDEAVNWESPARKQVQQAAKATRTTLRDLMSSHGPYNEATAQYAEAIPLFRKGYADKLRRAAVDNPESLIGMIKGTEPTKLGMLKEVLTEHGGEEGSTAWNHVRANWTHEKLVKGGVEGLGERLDKLDPEFVHHMYGDHEGQVVYKNLRSIADTLKQIQDTGGSILAEAKQAGRTAVGDARAAGDQLVAQAQTGSRAAVSTNLDQVRGARATLREVKKPTAVEEAFKKSSLAGKPPSGEDTLKAASQAALTHNYWRGMAVLKILKGPRLNDLITWASYADARTQLLTRALTSDAPGMVVADLLREAGIARAQGLEAVGRQGPQGAPPSRVGQPPPGPVGR